MHCLHAHGKVQELTHELRCYQWDVLGHVEVRWTGFGEISTDKGHKTWSCGEDQYGVAFIVRKEVVGSVISCTPISSSLISIWIFVECVSWV